MGRVVEAILVILGSVILLALLYVGRMLWPYVQVLMSGGHL